MSAASRAVFAVGVSMTLAGCPALLSDDWQIGGDGGVGGDDATGDLRATGGDASDGPVGDDATDGTIGNDAADAPTDAMVTLDAPRDATPDSSDGASSDSAVDGGCGTNVLCNGICVPSNPAHCGSSCTVCSPPPYSTATCTSGNCGYTCNIMACGSECIDPSSDRLNCGGCGNVCLGGATCTSGACDGILVCGSVSPYELAVSGTNVYFTQYSGGATGVYKVPTIGGTPTMLASDLATPLFLAIDATNAYWGDGTSVQMVPLVGGTSFALATGLNGTYPIQVTATDAYVVETGPHRVVRVPLGAGGAFPVASVPGNLHYSTIDATNVYMGDYDGSTTCGIYMAPLSGGTAMQLTSVQAQGVLGMAVDATNVYFTTHLPDAVMKVPIAGGSATLLASAAGRGVLVDSGYLYWADDGGWIKKIPVGGGAPVTLAGNQHSPWGIAIDATYVYWTNLPYPNGSIMKAIK